VRDNTLYFRVDDDNREAFKEAESFPPPQLRKEGRQTQWTTGIRRLTWFQVWLAAEHAAKDATGTFRGRRLAPAADTMSPVPPALSPLPPATPTTVTATHVAMRTDHHRLHRLSRLRCSKRVTPADRGKTGDSNDGARQDICQDVAATHCSHSVCSCTLIMGSFIGELNRCEFTPTW
jgi:hypothetical protein